MCKRFKSIWSFIKQNLFYTIYFTDDSEFVWVEDFERNFALRTGNDISRIIKGKASDVSAILFSNNIETAVGFMKRMNTGTRKSICTSKEISRVLFALMDKRKEVFGFVLDNENELNKLRAEFLRPEESNIKSLHADGMSKDGPYICAFDSDIKRIGNFITNCALNNRHSVIFCFDFQKGYIEDFIKECRNDMKNYNTEFSIKVVSKPVDEYRRRLFEQAGQENT